MQFRLSVILLALVGVFVTSVPLSRSSPIGAEEVLQEALARARDIKDQRLQQLALREVIHTAGRVGNAQVLLQLVDEAAELREEAIQQLVVLLARQGRVEEAANYIRSLQDTAARQESLREAIGALAFEGPVEHIEPLLTLAPSEEFRDDLLFMVVQTLRHEKTPDEALRFAKAIRNNSRRASAIIQVATNLAYSGRVQQAKELLQGHLKFSSPSDNFRLHMALATQLAKSGNLREAVSYARLAVAEAQRIDREEGLLRLEYLVSVAQDMPLGFSVSQWKSLAAAIVDKEERAAFLRAVCRRYAEEQQFEPAIALVDAIPTVEGKIYALTMLADMAKRNDAVVLLRRADSLLRRVRGSEARDDAITDVAVSMAKAAQFSRAVALASSVRGNFARLSLLNALLQEFKEQPLRREDRPALRRLAQLLQTTRVTWEDPELKEVFRDSHLVLAGVALALADDVNGVRQLLLQVRDKQRRREVLRGILGELMVTEIDHDVPVTEYPSLHWLNGGTISERLPTNRHYALIQKLLGQFGDADLKRWVAQQLADVLPEKELREALGQEKGGEPSASMVASRLAQAGQFEEAIALAAAEPREPLQAAYLAEIVKQMLQQDKTDEALRVLREHHILLEYPTAGGVLTQLVQKGRIGEAVELARKAPVEKSFTGGRSVLVRLPLLIGVHAALLEAGQKEQAARLLADILQEARQQEPTWQTVQLLCGLAEGISSR
jgi:flavin-binding protein dodecin